ncbi:iron permease [Irpex rosettiformis]|uniref:Iron permease n=1 Tax=Irpex rosettiformis TaxID=378272 RepID=A0ACB8TZG6_9APHY|nr:iron permease [Irpex rosettiformis]
MSPSTASIPQSISGQEKKNESDVAILESSAEENNDSAKTKKGLKFWLIILAICVAMFMSALEVGGTSTALPSIINDLHGDDFIWVGSAYPLAATALLPASGGMAEIFGRRFSMLTALGLFALGSALCGSAQNMSWLIAARTIQGAGGGAIQSVGNIIISDLVPLRERGVYSSFVGLVWTFAAGIGPLVGGALAEDGQWRWFFYMNLPICGLAAILVLAFVNLRTPPGTLLDKLSKMDWIGNFIFIGSSTSTAIALTWAGITFPWSSASTLVPLIVGLCGLAFFLFYEARFAKHPIVPFTLVANRTSLSGYLQIFFTPVITFAVTYYLATYYQSVKNANPIRAGIDSLSMSLSLGPTIIVTGISVSVTKRYRPQLWIGWVILTISMGVFTTVHSTTSIGHPIGFSVLVHVGAGMIYSAAYFPVLAPLPVSENAHALAFFAFCRTFASVWAITIGGTVLQNQLVKRLPIEFTSQFPSGAALAYSAIPTIGKLQDPLRAQVREAFAESIRVIWQVLTGISGLGLLCSLPMKGLPLHTQVDEKWGIEEGKGGNGEVQAGPRDNVHSNVADSQVDIGESEPSAQV